MNTYDGRCLYCGLVQPIMAESQEEADSLITKKCDCAGAAKQRKIDALAENIINITSEGHCEESNLKPIEPAAVDMLIAAGCISGPWSNRQAADIPQKAQPITIAVGSKGQVKVTRKETRGISAEC